MLLASGLFQWMSGLWGKLSFPPPAGQWLIDANGVALTMGQTVKLVGTVVSLSAVGTHFDGVGVQMIHPTGAASPNYGETFFVDPSQLVVGS